MLAVVAAKGTRRSGRGDSLLQGGGRSLMGVPLPLWAWQMPLGAVCTLLIRIAVFVALQGGLFDPPPT
jgi:hypothetical protein